MGLIAIVQFVFTLYTVILLARVLIGFVQVDPHHPVVQFLFQVTEPLLAPIRNFMPRGSGLDFSPLIAFIVIRVLEQIVIGLLISFLV